MQARASGSASSHEGGEFGKLRSQLVGDAVALLSRGLGVVRGEGGGDEGGDDASAVSPIGHRWFRGLCWMPPNYSAIRDTTDE
jgi:hypothetical protein